MFHVTQTRDKQRLASFFQRDPALYAYSLGDLDPAFFPNTTWWIAEQGNEIQAALLLYTAFDVPIVHGLADNAAQGALWLEVLNELPPQAYIHFRSSHADILKNRYEVISQGAHYKMRWEDSKFSTALETNGLKRLARRDEHTIREFYADTMPGAHFDMYMIEQGKAFGWFEADTLSSMATCHVYSEDYGVAAIGAVATRATFRGRGFASTVTRALTQDVAEHADVVSLNVHSENNTAIRIYERLGYRRSHEYEEAYVRRVHD